MEAIYHHHHQKVELTIQIAQYGASFNWGMLPTYGIMIAPTTPAMMMKAIASFRRPSTVTACHAAGTSRVLIWDLVRRWYRHGVIVASTPSIFHGHALDNTPIIDAFLHRSKIQGSKRRIHLPPSTGNNNSHFTDRPRRSLFSCPGADERKIFKAQSLGVDALVLDLEDGVAMDRKDDARDLVVATLHDTNMDFGNSELCVRINALTDTCDRRTKELALLDLQAILPCPRLETIVIPKVESPHDVLFVSRLIDMTPECRDRDIRLVAAIESARGMMNLRDIASVGMTALDTSSNRLDALVFASEDYCADMEAIRTAKATELLYARSQIVLTAKAYGLQAIDMVHIQYKDLDDLARECHDGRALGFTGKQAIHPMQISTIHTSFSPSVSDLDFASRVIQEYNDTTSKGGGATVVDGIVVDAPVYKWALKVIQRREGAGIDNSSK
jgi:citrate lyase subunit beta-like protein